MSFSPPCAFSSSPMATAQQFHRRRSRRWALRAAHHVARTAAVCRVIAGKSRRTACRRWEEQRAPCRRRSSWWPEKAAAWTAAVRLAVAAYVVEDSCRRPPIPLMRRRAKGVVGEAAMAFSL